MSFLSSFLKGSNKPNESKIELVLFQYLGRNKINMNPLNPKVSPVLSNLVLPSFTFPLWLCTETVSNSVEKTMSYDILGNNRMSFF